MKTHPLRRAIRKSTFYIGENTHFTLNGKVILIISGLSSRNENRHFTSTQMYICHFTPFSDFAAPRKMLFAGKYLPLSRIPFFVLHNYRIAKFTNFNPST